MLARKSILVIKMKTVETLRYKSGYIYIYSISIIVCIEVQSGIECYRAEFVVVKPPKM